MSAWSDEETRLQEALRQRGIDDVSSEDTEFLKVVSEARAKLEMCVVASMPCSSQRGMLREIRRCADIQILGEPRSYERQKNMQGQRKISTNAHGPRLREGLRVQCRLWCGAETQSLLDM